MTSYGRYILAAALCLLAAASCRRRPLDIQIDNVRFDLDNDYSMPFREVETLPSNYGVLLYDHETGALSYEDFCAESGGPIKGVPGHYSVLAYDLDNRVSVVDGMENMATVRVFTNEAPKALKTLFASCKGLLLEKMKRSGDAPVTRTGGPGFENENVVSEPDELFAGLNPDVEIPVMGYSDEQFAIPVSTKTAIQQGVLTFYGVTSTENILNVQAFLTNMSGCRYLATGEAGTDPVTLTFWMDDIREGRLSCVFNHFGTIPDGTYVNTAYVVITNIRRNSYAFVVDVTDQVLAQGEDMQIILDIPFDVPALGPGGEGSAGFTPTVDNWQNVYYDIPIGKLPDTGTGPEGEGTGQEN